MTKEDMIKYGKVIAPLMAIYSTFGIAFTVETLKKHRLEFNYLYTNDCAALGTLISLIAIVAIVFVFVKNNYSKLIYAGCGILNTLLFLVLSLSPDLLSSSKESLFFGFIFMLVGVLGTVALGVIEAIPDFSRITAGKPATSAPSTPTYDPSSAGMNTAIPSTPVPPVVEPVAPVVAPAAPLITPAPEMTAPVTTPANVFCSNCGNAVKSGNKFCTNCGSAIN